MQKAYPINNLLDNFNQLLSGIKTARQPFANEVFVFKTNIHTHGDKLDIKPHLDKHPLITQWNIDLEDVDCVLRIVTKHLDQHDIIELLAKHGYYCQELD